MTTKGFTFSPEWHAIGREAQLAAEQLAYGATLLGKANHAQKGLYTQAFFALSIGLERVAKLAIVANYAIENQGNFPDNNILKRNYGHDIDILLNHCQSLSAKWRNGKDYWEKPDLDIHKHIIKKLTEFAKSSRYYNLDFITGAIRFVEPIGAWWDSVGQLILQKHYTRRQRRKDEAQSKFVQGLIGDYTVVIHHDEKEIPLDNVETLAMHAGATRVVQKYGRFYTLQIIRWLAFLISDLSFIGAYQRRIESLLGLNEPFGIFMNGDSYFKSRKTWSIYRL